MRAILGSLLRALVAMPRLPESVITVHDLLLGSRKELGAALGPQLHIQSNASVAVHYQMGVKGDSRTVSDNRDLRVVYLF